MDTIGMDLHKGESQLCILSAEGEIRERRIRTTRDRLTAVLGGQPRARVLLEASTESEWVAQHLEQLGHEVIVADPNFAPMYATRSRRVKTDRRDARTLAEACRLGAYRPAHRLSAPQRHLRMELAVRDQLVQTRTRVVAVLKARLRALGERLPSGMIEQTAAKLAALALPPNIQAEMQPLVTLLAPLNLEIAAADARLTQLAATDPVVARLTTVPAIGPVTAAAFVATLDEVQRFALGPPARGVSGPDADGVQLGRTAPPGADQQDRQSPDALAPGRSRVARGADEGRPGGRAARVGRADRGSPGPRHCGRRAGPPARGHPVCDVARRNRVPPDSGTPPRRLTGSG